MFDHNRRVKPQRSTESVSEHLRDKTVKQRPKRMPGEKEERPFKELAEDDEQEKKKIANRPKTEGQSFLDVIGKGEDKKFSKALSKKAMESGKETDSAGKDFAPKLSKEEIAAIETPEPSSATIKPRDDVRFREASAPLAEAPPLAKQSKAELKERPLEKTIGTKEVPADAATEQVAASQVATPPRDAMPIQSTPQAPAAPMHKDLQKLVEKMVGQLQTVTVTDRTETVITMRQPGVFQGAEVTLTEFTAAKGEFNVSFTNLSPEARALVDNPENQGALKQAMETRGYPLHIIVTSAQDRQTLVAEAQETFDREGQQEQGQQDQDEASDEQEA